MCGSLWLKVLSVHIALFCVAASRITPSASSEPEYQLLPPLREQAAIQDAWTKDRISRIPDLLQKYGVDAWLISQREHAEDTVFWSLKSAQQFAARRRTTTLFLANATHGSPSSYNWIDNEPTLWSNLLAVLEAENPSSIALNIDATVAFSGGLHAGEMEEMYQQLGPQWWSRVVREPMLAVEYVGTMITERLPWYQKLQETAWAMISEGFSEEVITPGTTTTDDVEWFLRDKIQAMNYTTWFHPDVNVVDENMTMLGNPSMGRQSIINHGDLLHVDFGVTALGLNTDTQHLAYVLYPGETESDIPKGLLDGLEKSNRVQDILKSNMKIGSTGDEILKVCLDQMESEGIDGKIYSHPIGDWGHSAGTLIGMTNLQSGVPILGSLPLLPKTYYSIELNAIHFVPERGVNLTFYQEEDVYWVDDGEGGRWDWVYGRQEAFHVIRTAKDEGEGEGEGLRVQGEGLKVQG